MKTKTLLLTAALTAVGIASSMAQVYSVNAVGYVNVTVQKGYNLIANPLSNGGNMPNEIMPANANLPDDTLIVTWNSSAGTIGGLDPDVPTFFAGAGWIPDGAPLPPGKAFFLYVDPQTAPLNQYVITFVGEVMQSAGGTTPLSTPVGVGGRYSALASQVPQTGLLETDLKLTPAEDDIVLTWDKTKNPPGFGDNPYNYIGGWLPSEPTLAVGEGIFLFRTGTTPTAWTRVFSVNPTP